MATGCKIYAVCKRTVLRRGRALVLSALTSTTLATSLDCCWTWSGLRSGWYDAFPLSESHLDTPTPDSNLGLLSPDEVLGIDDNNGTTRCQVGVT